MSCHAIKSTLSSPDGNIWVELRDEMPEFTGAEDKAKAKRGWELIYKLGATLNGNGPLKLYLGPLALLSLDTPSLTSPCYNGTNILAKDNHLLENDKSAV